MPFQTFSAMRAVTDSDLSSTERMVFWALCIFASTDGRAWPGLESLSRLSGLNERTVRNTLRKLERRKLVVHIEQSNTKARMYELHPEVLPAWKQGPVDRNQDPGDRGSADPGSGDPGRRSGDPGRGSGDPGRTPPDRTTEQATDRTTEQTNEGPPKLRLVHPKAGGDDRYDEIARFFGEVCHRALGRRPSFGPDRQSKAGKKLEAAVRKNPEKVLAAMRYVAEGQGSHAEWLRDTFRPTVETVLNHLDDYASRYSDHDPDARPPKGDYVRGAHPGVPEPDQEQLDAFYAQAAAMGLDVGQ